MELRKEIGQFVRTADGIGKVIGARVYLRQTFFTVKFEDRTKKTYKKTETKKL